MALGIEYYSKRDPYLPPLAPPTHSVAAQMLQCWAAFKGAYITGRGIGYNFWLHDNLGSEGFPLPSHPPLSSFTFRSFSPCRDFLTSSIANI